MKLSTPMELATRLDAEDMWVSVTNEQVAHGAITARDHEIVKALELEKIRLESERPSPVVGGVYLAFSQVIDLIRESWGETK